MTGHTTPILLLIYPWFNYEDCIHTYCGFHLRVKVHVEAHRDILNIHYVFFLVW